MRLRILAAGFVAAFVLATCSDSDSTTSSTTTTTTTTIASTGTTASTSTTLAGLITVQVFFLDQDAFNVGRPPYTRPVERAVDAGDPAEGALRELFEGPTSDESTGGLRFVASGATGFADLRIVDGTASVRLVGGCSSGGSTFTVADEIAATLRQFTSVEAVKIFDPDGGTESPDEPGDSIPFCLEP